MSTTPETTAPKHSKAPWTRHTFAHLCVVSGQFIVANCAGNNRNYDVEKLDEEQEANTSVILSAPEMLALTQRIANLNLNARCDSYAILLQLVSEACAIMAKINPEP